MTITVGYTKYAFKLPPGYPTDVESVACPTNGLIKTFLYPFCPLLARLVHIFAYIKRYLANFSSDTPGSSRKKMHRGRLLWLKAHVLMLERQKRAADQCQVFLTAEARYRHQVR